MCYSEILEASGFSTFGHEIEGPPPQTLGVFYTFAYNKVNDRNIPCFEILSLWCPRPDIPGCHHPWWTFQSVPPGYLARILRPPLPWRSYHPSLKNTVKIMMVRRGREKNITSIKWFHARANLTRKTQRYSL